MEKKVNIKESVQMALDIVKLAVAEKGLSLKFSCSERVPSELMTDS